MFLQIFLTAGKSLDLPIFASSARDTQSILGWRCWTFCRFWRTHTFQVFLWGLLKFSCLVPYRPNKICARVSSRKSDNAISHDKSLPDRQNPVEGYAENRQSQLSCLLYIVSDETEPQKGTRAHVPHGHWAINPALSPTTNGYEPTLSKHVYR